VPRFTSFQKVGNEAQLKVTSYHTTLRALLNDRANLKQNAQQLIAALLTAYHEHVMNGVANRSV
jgi:hypothetical protein